MRRSSWVAVLGNDGSLTGLAGMEVDVSQGMLAEGAWSGEYSPTGFLTSSFRCASGLVVDGDEIVLLPPSHGLEGVYLYETSDSIWMSNSLHCLIAANPTAAPGNIQDVWKAARSIQEGKRDYQRLVYTADAGRLFRFAFGTVAISRKTRMFSERTPASSGGGMFRDYSQYKAHVSATLAALLENGRADGRSRPYRTLVTTCSGGYDSAACAALAAELGCDLALTVRSARRGHYDSGRPVAESLGIPCLEFDRFGAGQEVVAEGERRPTVEAKHVTDEQHDFLASGSTSEDMYFAAFAPHLEKTFVLTGFHGDKVWAKGCPSGEELKRGDRSGTGLDEFRKRMGFVHVPVPFIGAEAPEDIARIGASDEMRPWRKGVRYSRPIPRRIAEEAGVPGHLFGQKKAAASVLLRNARKAKADAFHQLVSEYRNGIRAAQRWDL